MADWARWVVVGTGLLVALVGYVQFRRGKHPGPAGVVTAALAIVAVLIMTVMAVVGLVGGHDLAEAATFYGYLATFVIAVPTGLFFSWMEPTKWSSMMLAASGFIVAVLALRLDQLWNL